MCCISNGQADIVELQEKLTGALIGLARATEGNDFMLTDATAAVTVEGLAATRMDGDFDRDALLTLLNRVEQEKRRLVPECFLCAASCGRTNDYDMANLRNGQPEIRTLKLRILQNIRDIAAGLFHTPVPGDRAKTVHAFLYKALFAIGRDDWGGEELLPIALEAERIQNPDK